MGDKSAISWTTSTWTPIRGVGTDRWLCQKVSPGCDHCYASTLNQSRIFNPNTLGPQSAYPEAGPIAIGTEIGAPGDRPLVLDERILTQPLRWQKPRKVFVCSMTDLFGEWVPDAWIDRVFAVMATAPQHTFQVLTKRARRMRDYLTAPGLYDRWLLAAARGRLHDFTNRPLNDHWTGHPLPNVWLGVSVERQGYDWRVNYLRETPAAVRFVSAEPLLGPLDLRGRLDGVHWLIDGGESGRDYRPANPEWFRSLRDQCQEAGVAYWHKQGSSLRPGKDTLLDGREWHQFPEEVRVA